MDRNFGIEDDKNIYTIDLFRVVLDIYKCKLLLSKACNCGVYSILGFLDFFKLMFHYALKTNDWNKVRISVYIRKQL